MAVSCRGATQGEVQPRGCKQARNQLRAATVRGSRCFAGRISGEQFGQLLTPHRIFAAKRFPRFRIACVRVEAERYHVTIAEQHQPRCRQGKCKHPAVGKAERQRDQRKRRQTQGG